MGTKTVELRPSSVDKATAVKAILIDHQEPRMIVCIGDGKTDEIIFSLLKNDKNAFTVTVGKKETEANFYIESPQEVTKLLNLL